MYSPKKLFSSTFILKYFVKLKISEEYIYENCVVHHLTQFSNNFQDYFPTEVVGLSTLLFLLFWKYKIALH